MPTVIGTSLDCGSGPHVQIFQEAGFVFREVSRHLDLRNRDQLIGALLEADSVIAGSEPYTEDVLKALPKLRVIARSGVGYDAIDLAACDRHRVVVMTTP